MNIEKERAAFEASVIGRNSDYETPAVLIERNTSGDYATVRINGEWIGWQARAAIVVEQEPVAWIQSTKNNRYLSWTDSVYGLSNDPIVSTSPLYAHPQPSADDARDITIILSHAYDEIAYLHSKIMQHAGIENDGRSNSVCVKINEFSAAMKGAK